RGISAVREDTAGVTAPGDDRDLDGPGQPGAGLDGSGARSARRGRGSHRAKVVLRDLALRLAVGGQDGRDLREDAVVVHAVADEGDPRENDQDPAEGGELARHRV